MSVRTVCVVITARPSYSRIRSALTAIDEHPNLELQLVVGASALLDRYGSAVHQIEADGFRIDREIFMVLEGETPTSMAKTTGIGLLELATVLHDLKPDVVLTIADRYETLATAVASTYMNMPLAHVQGGEVTGSIDEKVRHAVTKLADVHLVATDAAAERVIKMGERPGSVFVTGCPSIDLAAQILDAPEVDFDPIERYGGVGEPLDLSGGYLVVMQHPVTTEYEAARAQVFETLHAVNDTEIPTLWFWPNVDAGSDGTSNGIRAFREIHKPTNIHFFKNMAPTDFLKVVYGSECIVGNSSVGIRECSFLGVPAVNIGSRQGSRERGDNVLDVSYSREDIRTAIERHRQSERPTPSTIYGDGKAGFRVASCLAEVELRYEKMLTY